MNRDWNYIEKEGKQLKTVDDFKNSYVRTVKAHKKQDSNFNEKKFEEETRKEIIALRDSILTDNTESKKYKFILLRFIGEFLNKKALILKSKYDPAPDQFPRIYNWFIEQLDNIKDIDLQKEFIESEIEKTKKTSISWINNGTDLKDKFLKADFDAGQKYLVFLKQRLINYQHTPTASAHEKIVKDYNSLGNYLPQEEEELLLAEELENRLIIEGVNYKHVLSERWETFQFDKEYFKKFIPHSLYSEFIYSLYAKLEPWNNQEINRYLTLSIAQFKRFHPEYREQQFIKKFAACYWYPNVVEKVYEDEERYAKFVLKEFTAHYNLFVKEAEKSLKIYRKVLLGQR
ncbi:MAG: hypothetical protein IPJ93_02480 [Bacteroidota bacterium]|nr:MAG: hypothetical protein IPJ93_02480 [Bacteroidota bacterium]